MKLSYLLPAVALIGFACSNEGNPDLEKLQAKRDSIQTVIDESNTALLAVKEEIKLIDKKEAKRFAVTLNEVNMQPFEHFIKIQGTIEADKSVQLNAQANGIVKAIHVQEGNKVSAGQRLISLDTEILDNQINELNTSYELASFVFEKQERLWKQNIGSELEYKQAKNNKVGLEQKLATLKAQKALSVITAPFSGTVDDIFPKQGELATMGAPMLRIVNLNNLQVEAEVPETYIQNVRKNDKLLVELNGSNGKIETRINQVANYIQPANRTFKIRSKIAAKDLAILPNQIAQVYVCDYRTDKAISVSNQAVQQDLSGKDYVFIAQKTNAGLVAKKVSVTTGYTNPNSTEIKAGLNAGDKVIISGARSIKEGDLLSVLK